MSDHTADSGRGHPNRPGRRSSVTGSKMAADRLVVGSAGNLSIRLGDTVVMTPTGINYDQITERNICVLDAEGTLLDGDGGGLRSGRCTAGSTTSPMPGPWCTRTPRSRWPSPRCATELPAIHYTILRLGGPTVRVAPYTTFGSDGAGRRTPRTPWTAGSRALLQNHGAIAYGNTIDEAYDRALLLEWLAEVYWRARLAGSPRILTTPNSTT